MGSLACPSAILVLFVVALQTEANRLPWHSPLKKEYKSYLDRSPYSLLDDDTKESLNGSLPQDPQSANEEPDRKASPTPAPKPVPLQSQEKQDPVKPLKWKFPSRPVPPTEPEVPVVPKMPVPANSVAAKCGATDVQVEVHRDFFGTGRLIQPADMLLGDCTFTREDLSAQVLLFESELHGCGSSLQVTEDELVYTFTLTYVPKVYLGTSIMRMNSATVDINCHYQRVHNVSSDVITPTWIPFTATEVAEEVLVFSLRLMTDDWKFEQASNAFYLGDLLHMEASVIQYNHVPLRVFVHSCVATPVRDLNTSPRYSFIENHGCFVDAKLTGSRSRFLPRAQDNQLRFELEAFKFAPGYGDDIYITCELVATAASTVSKACSFANDRWTSSGGMDEMCACCDSTCGTGQPEAGEWNSEASLGPIKVKKQN
ncbi:zona pellucida sperm-binding protein 3-like [Sardina pilchardus]|uniref:zona pellucida sperm-binding protein 3-like n=1 Tax=Sardina pilchardus TaxID=27697 RepID=UPI002E120FBE